MWSSLVAHRVLPSNLACRERENDGKNPVHTCAQNDGHKQISTEPLCAERCHLIEFAQKHMQTQQK